MYVQQLLDVIVSSAALRPTSYYVSLYFVNVSKRNLAFIPFNLNFSDNGLCSVFMELLKA